MNRRLAQALTRLQPRKWRERYGGEFAALLLELPASPAIVADAIKHALALRRRFIIAFACAVTVAMSAVAGVHVFGAGASRQSAQESTLGVCRTYSATSSSEVAHSERCLS